MHAGARGAGACSAGARSGGARSGGASNGGASNGGAGGEGVPRGGGAGRRGAGRRGAGRSGAGRSGARSGASSSWSGLTARPHYPPPGQHPRRPSSTTCACPASQRGADHLAAAGRYSSTTCSTTSRSSWRSPAATAREAPSVDRPTEGRVATDAIGWSVDPEEQAGRGLVRIVHVRNMNKYAVCTHVYRTIRIHVGMYSRLCTAVVA